MAGGRRRGPDEAAEDLAAFGVPEEQIAELLPEGNPSGVLFAIWPENREAVEVFLALSTQWRFEGMSGTYFGLDYPGVEAALRMLRIKDRRAVFDDLRAMERAALEELNAEP